MAQTPFWVEDFNTGAGWDLEENWLIDGGKLTFYWSPNITNFDVSAYSPVITLHESVGELAITQYLDAFSTSSNEVAEISILFDDTEDVLWSHPLSAGNWGTQNGEEIEFSLTDYAGMDVQFRIRTYGNDSFNWNWWDVFKMEMTVYLDNDLSVTSISGPAQIELLEMGEWTVEVKNSGSSAISDFEVKLFDFKTGDMIGSIDDMEVIEPQESKSYSFEWNSAAAYNTVFYGAVVSEGDEFEGNNVSKSHFVRVNPDEEFTILVWDNDNEIPTVTCPEKGDEIQPSEGLTRVLDDAGYNYLVTYFLPDNLYPYDIIFSTMGCFCVS